MTYLLLYMYDIGLLQKKSDELKSCMHDIKEARALEKCKSDFGRYMRKLRIERNYTVRSLSKELNCTYQQINGMEVRNGYPSILTIKRIADVYGMQISDFFKGFEDNNASMPSLTCCEPIQTIAS